MNKRIAIIFFGTFFTIFAVWSAYWVFSAHKIKSTLQEYITDKKQPIQLHVDNMSLGGYPFHHKIHFSELHFKPHSGAFIRIHKVTAIALAYKPTHWIAETTHPFEISSPDNHVSGESKLMQVSLVLPTTAKKKDIKLGFSAEKLILLEDRLKISFDDIKASTIIRDFKKMDGAISIEAHKAKFDAPEGSLQLEQATFSSESLPESKHFKWDLSALESSNFDFEIDTVRGDVFYKQATDAKKALPNFQNMKAWFATLHEIQLNAFHIALDDIVFKGNGTVTFLPDGTPEGRIDIALKNWRSALLKLSEFEEIPTTNQEELEGFLDLMTLFSKDPNLFEIGLDLRNGQMFLGNTAIMQF